MMPGFVIRDGGSRHLVWLLGTGWALLLPCPGPKKKQRWLACLVVVLHLQGPCPAPWACPILSLLVDGRSIRLGFLVTTDRRRTLRMSVVLPENSFSIQAHRILDSRGRSPSPLPHAAIRDPAVQNNSLSYISRMWSPICTMVVSPRGREPMLCAGARKKLGS